MKRVKKLSSWRKIAMASWSWPKEPNVFGFMEVDVEESMEYLQKYQEKHNTKITITHMVAKAVAMALKENSDVNTCIRWGRIYQRENVDLFLQVVLEENGDLSGAKIERADEKSLKEFAEELREKSKKIRDRQDPQFEKTKGVMKWMPIPLLRWVLKFSDFVGNTLLWSLPSLGIPKDPFGSAMITSVGMMGIDVGFAPFPTFSRTPLVVVVGKVEMRPRVVEGKVEARKTILLSASFDHRVVDGFQIGKFILAVRRFLEKPGDEVYLEPIEAGSKQALTSRSEE